MFDLLTFHESLLLFSYERRDSEYGRFFITTIEMKNLRLGVHAKVRLQSIKIVLCMQK